MDPNPSDCTCPNSTIAGHYLMESQDGIDGYPPGPFILFCPYNSPSNYFPRDPCEYRSDSGILVWGNSRSSCPLSASEAPAWTVCRNGHSPVLASPSLVFTVSSSLTSPSLSPSSSSASSSTASQTSLSPSPSSVGPADRSPNPATTITLGVVAGAAVLLTLVLLFRNRRNNSSAVNTQPDPLSNIIIPYRTLSPQQPHDPPSPESYPLITTYPDRLTYTPRGVEFSFNRPQSPESPNSPPGRTKTLRTSLSQHNTPVPSGSSAPRATTSPVYRSMTSPPSRAEAGPSNSRSPILNSYQLPEEQASPQSNRMPSPDMGPQVETLRLELSLRTPQATAPEAVHPPPLYDAES